VLKHRLTTNKTHIPGSEVLHAACNLKREADKVASGEAKWIRADWAACSSSLWWWLRLVMQWVDVVVGHCLVTCDQRLSTAGRVQRVNKATSVFHQIVAQTSVGTVLDNHIQRSYTNVPIVSLIIQGWQVSAKISGHFLPLQTAMFILKFIFKQKHSHHSVTKLQFCYKWWILFLRCYIMVKFCTLIYLHYENSYNANFWVPFGIRWTVGLNQVFADLNQFQSFEWQKRNETAFPILNVHHSTNHGAL